MLIRDLTDEPGVVKTAVEYEGKENVIIENLTHRQENMFSQKYELVKKIVDDPLYIKYWKATDCLIHVQ